MKESVQQAFSFLQLKKTELGIARDLDVSHIHVEVIDLIANRVEAELGVAFCRVLLGSAKVPVSPALLILGDMSIQGISLSLLTEALQVAKDNGAKRALIPIENKRNFLDVSADIMEQVDPISSEIRRLPQRRFWGAMHFKKIVLVHLSDIQFTARQAFLCTTWTPKCGANYSGIQLRSPKSSVARQAHWSLVTSHSLGSVRSTSEQRHGSSISVPYFCAAPTRACRSFREITTSTPR